MSGCGKRLTGGVSISCKFCGDRHYCSKHRLPEDHACDGQLQMIKVLREALKVRLESEVAKASKCP